MNQVPPVSPGETRCSSFARRGRSTTFAKLERTSPVVRAWPAAARCCGRRTSD